MLQIYNRKETTGVSRKGEERDKMENGSMIQDGE